MSLGERSIEELRRELDSGSLGPRELAEDCLRRAHESQPRLGAFQELVEFAPDAGIAGPLHGIPFATKANIAALDARLDCESAILAGYRAPYEATVHRRLREAGAVCLGRTRMDEFAMGSSGERATSGETANPWREDRVPGGSSSGSAAAVGAGIVPFALGSDTGGSIRQPAAFCGCVGLKPTYGRVSRYGLVAFASSFDQVGPITRGVRDAALVFSVLAGLDPRDASTRGEAVEDPLEGIEEGPRGLRVGVPTKLLREVVDPRPLAEMQRVLTLLEDQGAEIVELELPLSRHALACYAVIANAEASSNLARFDGVRFGRRAEGEDLESVLHRTRSEGFGEEVKLRILLGSFVLCAGYRGRYLQRAQRLREGLRQETREALGRCEVLAWPTAPHTAFRRGERLQDPLEMYRSDALTVQANLTGHPAIAIPTGLDDEGLPFSLQLTGRELDERGLLRAARAVEKLCALDRSALRDPWWMR